MGTYDMWNVYVLSASINTLQSENRVLGQWCGSGYLDGLRIEADHQNDFLLYF